MAAGYDDTMRWAAPIFYACGCAALCGQTLTVEPSRALADREVVIRASGLDAGERVAIRSELLDANGHHWTAEADFTADSAGAVDVSRQAPVAGAYKEVSAMGLVWSMMPQEHSAQLYQPPHNFAPQPIEFHLLRKGQPAASARFEQLALAEGVRRIPLHEGSLRGLLLVPPGDTPRPGIMVLSGSNGGLPVRPAAWFASHGFVALALAYFRYDDLPNRLENIPLEYFGRGIEWMAQRPEMAGKPLAVSGTSRGGELALQLGSMYPRIRAVVAYVPANVRFPACCGNPSLAAWTWEGRPLAFLPPRFAGSGSLEMRAEIAVELTHGPILTISGQDDHVWRSASMADSVIARLKRHNFAYDCENLKYARAGHSAGRPDIAPAWHGHPVNPTSGREMDLGGSPRGDFESSIDSMPKVLEFLKKALKE